ncbi:MAG TPA: glutamine synthetase family protein [Polyangiaceae bacterium LLY-WYZ-15_(1-7)]|nr:glutamine synthetase [Sandaracinus sp.]HBP21038.1 glutamine synthetase [Planctomycetota bacterium]HJK92857.1 glutamine synthetase family protein [Polyangiaceae bacterium LLY-WYZ-15_(1-7)]HJL04192.1 glutamine synthetase family protein [Polyangiaceae bacterium LLY-WYZ-15_(1-7)]HJL10430.1 glutamine synthetase family protein [Polyangiaceae bacterium LLY-WYZ-15_(1-7)]
MTGATSESASDVPTTPEELRARFEERGIRKVKVGGFDVDGVLRGKLISLAKFWSAVEKGFGFCDVIFGWDIADNLYDNVAVTGWASGYPDALAKIDLSTFRVLPYEPDTACFLVDFHTPEGKPHPACPRGLLKRVAARAESAGYRPVFSGELEFWVFRESPESLREKGYRQLTPLSPGMFGYSWLREGQHAPFVHDVLDTMKDFRIDVEGLHTETGPGVWEAAIRYADVIEAADQAALFKTTMKQICHRHGLAVTFMAKWSPDLPGSSGHLHQSLWDSTRETNLFADPKDPTGLSSLAQHYVAGLVTTAPDLTALYSPFINSFRRYVPGMWAPLTSTWGIENRTCSVRVINGPGASAARAELRQTAADLNPYVAMATALGAGLHGIEKAVDLPPETKGDATGEAAQGPALPQTLDQAVRMLRESEAARAILGEGFVDHYARTREWEVREHRKSVSQWELERYFEGV